MVIMGHSSLVLLSDDFTASRAIYKDIIRSAR